MRHRRARRTAAIHKVRQRFSHRCRTKQAKGRENEAKVRKALEFLEEEGYIVCHTFSIPNDALDRMGIDAGLTPAQGVQINFQIKSSDRGVQKHLLKHPDIPCLNVRDCVDVLDVVRLIRKQFGLSRKQSA